MFFSYNNIIFLRDCTFITYIYIYIQVKERGKAVDNNYSVDREVVGSNHTGGKN